MMRRRAVGRPVARAMVGTAVVAGTAGAVHHHQAQRYAKQDQQAYEAQMYEQQMAQQQMYEQQMAPQQYAPPPEQYAAPVEQAPAPDLTAQLQQLAQLHQSGVLSDEEFAAAKQKLLAS